MQIDRQLIQHLCLLAHLHPSPEREDALRQQLQRLVEAFAALGEVAPDATGPTGPAAPTNLPPTIGPETLRADHAEPPPDPADVLANAPQVAADCFVVPRVVEP